MLEKIVLAVVSSLVEFQAELLMLDPTSEFHPTITFRPIRPSDLDVLEQIHVDIFPVRYARDFFLSVVNGHDIVSWGAVDTSRSDSHRDELVGFVTMKIVGFDTSRSDSEAQEVFLKIRFCSQLYGADYFPSQIEDLFRYNNSRNDLALAYILTLGVVDRYRNLGIASSLVQEVIKYARSITNCRGVYLHVISYNQPAISFYEKMLFNLV